MRTKTAVCSRYGYEEHVEMFTQLEAQVKRISLGAPRCKKCGSTDVRMYD
jgi:hypothetical protein